LLIDLENIRSGVIKIKSITEQFADFVIKTNAENIPSMVVEDTKKCIIDSLGVTLSGYAFKDVQGIIREFKKHDSNQDVSVLGQRTKLSLLNGVMINGTMGHALEMDDVHKKAKVHAGAVIVPAAFSLSEYLQSSGQKFIEAVLCGYEIMIRVGQGMGASSHREKGWHATSTAGTFGAAAAAAKLFNFNKTQTVSALGLAGTQSSGLWAFKEDGASCKKFHSGMAAHSGILAGLLTAGGMTGPRRIIEADDGGLFKAVSDNYNYDIATNNLGLDYEITQVDRKPFACCRSMHPSITAIFKMKNNDLKVEEIKKINVNTYEIAIKQCYFTKKPKDVNEAKFCIPYGVAVALLDGNASVGQFTEDRVKDPQVLALAEKVVVEATEKYNKQYPEKWSCEVIIEKKDGSVLTEEVQYAKGDFKNPLSDQELKNKYRLLAGPFLNSVEIEKTLVLLEELHTLNNIKDLAEVFSHNA